MHRVPVTDSAELDDGVRAWRCWAVDLDSGCLAAPLSWMNTGAPTMYPTEVSEPTQAAGDGPPAGSDAGRFYATTSAFTAIGMMLVLPWPPKTLAYGEVRLTGPVEHLGGLEGRLREEVATTGPMRIVSLSLSELLPNATRCRVRLRYPGARLLAPWPLAAWRNAEAQRVALDRRVRAKFGTTEEPVQGTDIGHPVLSGPSASPLARSGNGPQVRAADTNSDTPITERAPQ